MQFMGKDNVPFHTVIFPATLLGTGQPWTMMRSISVTEYLNYEGSQFSKSRGTGVLSKPSFQHFRLGRAPEHSTKRVTYTVLICIGVFGNDITDTSIPVDVWRYYLLANRPESDDTDFKWSDLQARNNGELLANLGNFVNRVLQFTASKARCVVHSHCQQATLTDDATLRMACSLGHCCTARAGSVAWFPIAQFQARPMV